ncbi:uncharacterized protein EDB93DRAFT_1107609 [Suillus bovinus]|uniref:uncharacterized protein n=1 Tax=Suillus bovinus TaxID=48563 RepID=UPI001B875E2F|nr:uncharacterized protein EDB93DRAFT_1107609 [Suillus bovinus]KAG2133229.1 hypothetical protein EDB93DRAFT_1107609 [Suillus bovinus]
MAKSGGRPLPKVVEDNFDRLEDVPNSSNRSYFKCKHCPLNSPGAHIENRDNNLPKHLTDATQCRVEAGMVPKSIDGEFSFCHVLPVLPAELPANSSAHNTTRFSSQNDSNGVEPATKVKVMAGTQIFPPLVPDNMLRSHPALDIDGKDLQVRWQVVPNGKNSSATVKHVQASEVLPHSRAPNIFRTSHLLGSEGTVIPDLGRQCAGVVDVSALPNVPPAAAHVDFAQKPVMLDADMRLAPSILVSLLPYSGLILPTHFAALSISSTFLVIYFNAHNLSSLTNSVRPHNPGRPFLYVVGIVNTKQCPTGHPDRVIALINLTSSFQCDIHKDAHNLTQHISIGYPEHLSTISPKRSLTWYHNKK